MPLEPQRTGIDDVKDSRKTLLPALLAVSGGMIGTSAGAIELGEINVQSALGQPLRASVAFALHPSEQLADYCISVRPAPQSSGIPTIDAARITVANGVINLAGRSVVNEPMASLRLDINCPYTPHLVREYMIFLDPAVSQSSTATATATVASEPPARASAEAAATRRRTVAARPEPRPSADLIAGERYRVQPGDTLSEIAQRVDGRTVNLWTAVNEIFVANPDAFLNDDPNRLKAGTWITVPAAVLGGSSLAASESASETGSLAATLSPASAAAAAEAAEAPAATYDLVANTTPDAVEPAVVPDTTVFEAPQTPAAERTPAETLTTGDVIIDQQPEATPAAAPDVTGVETDSSAWGWWFGGAGLLLLGGLAMFGRRRNTPPPKDLEARQDKPKRYLEESPAVEVIESHSIPTDIRDVDYNLNDDSPTEENLIIDADLEHGTGLDAGVDVDVAEDFSFASTTELDLELPADAHHGDGAGSAAGCDDTVEQEITIEQEAPAIDQLQTDDDYDMSVIVDVMQLNDDEITERDLKAVVVPDDDEDAETVSSDYTISQEADYDIVEQRFEDELSATQALNAEIERAAAELAKSAGDDVADQVGESRVEEAAADDASGPAEEDPAMATAQMATVTPIDATANLPGEGSDNTVIGFDDVTAEMPRATEEDDVTAEMPARSGKRS